MSPQHWLEAATYLFNIVGILVCIIGLTLAKRWTRRWPGYVIAVIGFMIAAMPMFYQMVQMLQRPG